MKFTAEKRDLVRAISAASGAVESRNTIPVLGNVLIEVVEGAGFFSGTNLDQQIRASFDVSKYYNGAITAPAAKIKDIINAAQDGAEVSFDLGADTVLTVKYGRSRFKVQTLPADDFPLLAVSSPDVTVTVPASDLYAALKYVEFSQSTEETRYYLNGVNIECLAGGELKIASTDGHKLSSVSMAGVKFDGEFAGIIPRRAVGEVLRLLPKSGAVTFAAGKVFSFDMGDVQLSSKSIDGSFPDYRRVIPTSNKHTVKIDAKRLSQAVKRAIISSDGKSAAVKLDIADGDMTVSARGSLSEGADVMAVDADFSMEIGLNGKYLIDALARYEGDVDVSLKDAESPTLWKDERGLTVIMPLRI